jgi:hypothetical protein
MLIAGILTSGKKEIAVFNIPVYVGRPVFRYGNNGHFFRILILLKIKSNL